MPCLRKPGGCACHLSAVESNHANDRFRSDHSTTDHDDDTTTDRTTRS